MDNSDNKLNKLNNLDKLNELNEYVKKNYDKLLIKFNKLSTDEIINIINFGLYNLIIYNELFFYHLKESLNLEQLQALNNLLEITINEIIQKFLQEDVIENILKNVNNSELNLTHESVRDFI